VNGSEPSSRNYAICVGGYPLAYHSTFAAAAEAAKAALPRRDGLDDDISIYEVETGIHFEVPAACRIDDDFPQDALVLLSRIGFQSG